MEEREKPDIQGGAEGQPEPAPPTKPAILVKVVREKMEVELMFQRTSADTADPLVEDVMADIAAKGIVYGLNEDNLRDLCRQPSYNNSFVIARGTPQKVGTDGSLKFLVNTARHLRPKILEDGTADYKDLGFIQNIYKGDRLCEIYPPEKGEDGVNVLGQVLPGIYGREVPPPTGSNTVVVEEPEQGIHVLQAASDGNLEYKKGALHIIEVLKIGGNVDNSTGDINFVGDVIVSGDVVSGFNVKSGGSIVVKGSVEGARLEAAGDISINEGMNGMNRGALTTGGSVKCKYIQSCFIKTDGNVYADTLMYCTVECGGNVELSGKRGALIGGRASIAGQLLAKTIGSSTHIATEINMVAGGLSQSKEALAIATEIKRLDGEITKLIQVMTRYDEIAKKVQLTEEQVAGILQVKESYTLLSQTRKETQMRLEKLKQEQLKASMTSSYIECKDRVHTGVRISFGPLTTLISESFVYSRIQVIDGEIAMSPL